MTNTTKLSKRGPWLAVVATCVMSAFSAPAFAAESQIGQQPAKAAKSAVSRTVTVAGLGEVMVAPDSLRTRISIRARAETLEQARREVASKTRSVMQALETLGIPALQVRTVEITVTPIPERQKQPDAATPPRIIGYEAESTLSVALRGVAPDTLRSLGPKILDTALAAGANVVGGIDFFLSKPREAHRLALAAAVRDAEQNAKVMAGAARVKLHGLKTLSTEGGQTYEYAQQAKYGADEAGAIGFPVEPGEIRVTTQVTATFVFTK